MRRALFFLISIVVALPLVPVSAPSPVTAVIKGPSAIEPASVHEYVVTVAGGPGAENGTFEIAYVLKGDNLVGADPQVERTSANAAGAFAVNVTAPEAEGHIALHVRATSSRGEMKETTDTRFIIEVVRSIELRATLRNQGAAAVTNVTVLFYVDGVLVGNQTLVRIDAGGRADVNLTYIPLGLSVGRHTVQIKADLDGDGEFSPERGELVTTQFFYKSVRTQMPAILGTITVLILVILVFVLLAIRRQRRLG